MKSTCRELLGSKVMASGHLLGPDQKGWSEVVFCGGEKGEGQKEELYLDAVSDANNNNKTSELRKSSC